MNSTYVRHLDCDLKHGVIVTRHALTSLDFDKLAKIQDTYKLVGYVSQNSHRPNYVHLALT